MREWRNGRIEEGNERRSEREGKEDANGGRMERGRDGAAERGRWAREDARNGGSKGGKLQGRYPKEDTAMTSIRYTAHKTTHKAVLASDTSVLQIK